MTFDAALIEEAAKALYVSYVDEGGIDGLDSKTYPWETRSPKIRERFYREARAVLAVFRSRSRDAELAWDEAVEESHASGWLHDFAKSDALGRNPYRLRGRPELGFADRERRAEEAYAIFHPAEPRVMTHDFRGGFHLGFQHGRA